ncbi:hypothetical protein GMRT_13285 [Giardia muris]|uniref:Uncharacterized protein n=1 Tax=Giardia muris TaxID=5742 RepID=A0A4Z1T151_GIAMU|nr:hypothetical protein GMRT_13285 [Giardia muris]|eukprot:TNJ26249.1 hypothetical protein GMRT_13285 [Giardia muris]
MRCKYCSGSFARGVRCRTCGADVCRACTRMGQGHFRCIGCICDSSLALPRPVERIARLPIAKRETSCHICGTVIHEKEHCTVLCNSRKRKICETCYRLHDANVLDGTIAPGPLLTCAEPALAQERYIGQRITPELLSEIESFAQTLGASAIPRTALIRENLFLPYAQLVQLAEVDDTSTRLLSKSGKGLQLQLPGGTKKVIEQSDKGKDLIVAGQNLLTYRNRVYHSGQIPSVTPEAEAFVGHLETVPAGISAHVKCARIGALPSQTGELLFPRRPTALDYLAADGATAEAPPLKITPLHICERRNNPGYE